MSSLELSAPDPQTTVTQGTGDELARQMTNGKTVTSATATNYQVGGWAQA